ncbi:MAG: maleylpyruvate isomerase N-terminal domain-containing protein [Acidobacteria bacterium]|nr:maleylpyruvate isomerase N-terminal domain-containing protein [Acidobacteriota bacterium]
MAYEWLVAALRDTWGETDRLISSLSESELLAPTPCPGWSVRDVVSHLVGFELMLLGEPMPSGPEERPDYVRNDIGALNEAFVHERRSKSRDEVVEEFRRVTTRALSRLEALGDDEWSVLGWSPEGEAPYHRFMETRLLDSWIHLQDIRDGLAMPSDDHGVGEEVVLNRFEAALPYVIGKRAAAPDGSRVRVNISGRLARTTDIVVVDGRATAASTSGEPTLEISTPAALFWRRAAGRITARAFLEASATDVRGDRDLAGRIAEGLAIMI